MFSEHFIDFQPFLQKQYMLIVKISTNTVSENSTKLQIAVLLPSHPPPAPQFPGVFLSNSLVCNHPELSDGHGCICVYLPHKLDCAINDLSINFRIRHTWAVIQVIAN